MIINFQKILMPFLFSFLFIGCKSLGIEKTETLDLSIEENSYELTFSNDSEVSLYLFRLEIYGIEYQSALNTLEAKISNQLDSNINIKVQVENEEFEILSESEIYYIEGKEEKILTFDFDQVPEDSKAACITFFIEGKLSDGTVLFENIKRIKN